MAEPDKIFFPVIQKKVVSPSNFPGLESLSETLLAFIARYNRTAGPFSRPVVEAARPGGGLQRDGEGRRRGGGVPRPAALEGGEQLGQALPRAGRLARPGVVVCLPCHEPPSFE
jgi:hypothetical protein